MIIILSLREALATKQSRTMCGLPRSFQSLAMTLFTTFFVFFSSISLSLAEEGYCDDAQNTIQLNECGHIYWKREDAALQIIYDKLIKKLKEDDEQYPLSGPSRSGNREKTLREAQRAWIKFRDLNCNYETFVMGGGGTISGQLEYGCLTTMTKQRALDLQKMLNFSWEN